MFYDTELKFFQTILTNMNIPHSILTEKSPVEHLYDQGLHQLLHDEQHYAQMISDLLPRMQERTIYRATNVFYCNYILLLLPDTKTRTAMVIGPYLDSDFSSKNRFELVQKQLIPEASLRLLDDYYTRLRVIRNDEFLLCLLNALGSHIWGGTSQFQIFNANEHSLFVDDPSAGALAKNNFDNSDTDMINARYRFENQLIHAVSIGQVIEAETVINNLNLLELTNQHGFSIERMRSYATVTNTILRKAAEYGGVHPVHVHRLFSSFLQEAESLQSIDEGKDLIRRMVRKYCLLVQNYATPQYSPLIKQVITEIELNLSGDLSLRKLARQFNISPNHLSSLFHKEAKSTLTSFTNQKRIEHAILLLNTTNWQIQTIAQSCGIMDSNYFTKLFKKHVGMTPYEYRRQISQTTR